MEITHIQKNLNTTPRKLRLVADLVRKMSPSQAILTLQFTPKAAALPLQKALKTAVANARIQNLDTDQLKIKALEVNEAAKLGRMRIAGRSHRQPYRIKTSQVKIVLTDQIESGKEQN